MSIEVINSLIILLMSSLMTLAGTIAYYNYVVYKCIRDNERDEREEMEKFYTLTNKLFKNQDNESRKKTEGNAHIQSVSQRRNVRHS